MSCHVHTLLDWYDGIDYEETPWSEIYGFCSIPPEMLINVLLRCLFSGFYQAAGVGGGGFVNAGSSHRGLWRCPEESWPSGSQCWKTHKAANPHRTVLSGQSQCWKTHKAANPHRTVLPGQWNVLTSKLVPASQLAPSLLKMPAWMSQHAWDGTERSGSQHTPAGTYVYFLLSAGMHVLCDICSLYPCPWLYLPP